MQHKRLKTFFIFLALILAISLLALSIRKRVDTSGKIAVAVYTFPQDATVTIGGKSHTEGTVYLSAGDYVVSSSKAGYGSFSRTYSVDPSIADPVINVVLTPQSSAARTYYSQHAALFKQREGVGSQQAHQQSSLIISKNPLTTKLPYRTLLYTIGYRSDPADPTGQSVIITIDALTGDRNAAVQQIKQLGYNPADYTIEFKNYVNPFQS